MKGISCIFLLAITSIECSNKLQTLSCIELTGFPCPHQHGHINRGATTNDPYSNTRGTQQTVPSRSGENKQKIPNRGYTTQDNEYLAGGSQNTVPQDRRAGYGGRDIPAQPTTPSVGLSSRQRPSAKISDFSWNLFKNVLDKETGNIVVSPVVLQFQLSILERAAEGKTLRELRNITGGISANHLNGILTSSDGSSVLELANAIFIDSSLRSTPDQTFQNEVSKLKTVIQTIDFKRDAETAITRINNWAAQSTRNTITEILPRQATFQGIQMLLCSAIYFKGIWKNKFNDSGLDMFTNEDGETVDVPFMEIKNNILVDKIPINRIDTQVIEIPYEGGNYVMLIILPEDERPSTLNNIIKSVNSTFLSDTVANMSKYSPQRLTLKMPKFKVTSNTVLRQILQSMELVDLFTSSARLPGLGLQSVDEILHQGVLNVDETGTTAAAISTSFLIPLSADFVVNQKIVIDKPFLSVIYDKKNDIPLLISKISRL